MEALDLKEAVEAVSQSRSVEGEAVLTVLSDALLSVCSDVWGGDSSDVSVVIDENYSASLSIFKEVVVDEKPYNIFQISLEDALAKDSSAKEGSKVLCKIDFSQLTRGDIIKIRRNLMHRIGFVCKEVLFKELKLKEGSLVNGTYMRKSRSDMFFDLSKIEGRMPRDEQIPAELYRQGDRVRLYLKSVTYSERGMIDVVVSRADGEFVKKLFELEVPEIQDGTIRVRSVARDAGKKTKLSVYTNRVSIDPVGACVGISGVRIKTIVKELGGERIDVLRHSENFREFIANAMQPAQVRKVVLINEENKEVLVVVDDEQYSLAIGKSGVNIRLAAELTGWRLNLKSVSQIQEYPEIFKMLSKAESVFSESEKFTDLSQLTDVPEEILVRLLNEGITTISELYEKTEQEIASVEGVGEENAKLIRKVLDEVVEIVEEGTSDSLQIQQDQEFHEFGAQETGVDESKPEYKEDSTISMQQVLQQEVEFLVCPSCDKDFEYQGVCVCPLCGVEFDVEE